MARCRNFSDCGVYGQQLFFQISADLCFGELNVIFLYVTSLVRAFCSEVIYSTNILLGFVLDKIDILNPPTPSILYLDFLSNIEFFGKYSLGQNKKEVINEFFDIYTFYLFFCPLKFYIKENSYKCPK